MASNPAWNDATALWDSDVDMVLSGVYQQTSNISPYVTSTQQYINSIKIFDTQEKALSAKSLVVEFNREATTTMDARTHPTLSDVESATIFRLGIFTYEEAAAFLPGFQDKWSNWVDDIQTLLTACSQYATIKHQNQQQAQGDYYEAEY